MYFRCIHDIWNWWKGERPRYFSHTLLWSANTKSLAVISGLKLSPISSCTFVSSLLSELCDVLFTFHFAPCLKWNVYVFRHCLFPKFLQRLPVLCRCHLYLQVFKAIFNKQKFIGCFCNLRVETFNVTGKRIYKVDFIVIWWATSQIL